jgi:hypothetical protein
VAAVAVAAVQEQALVQALVLVHTFTIQLHF